MLTLLLSLLYLCCSGYGVLGEWSCALRVLERMRDKGVRPTIVTYGTLMKVWTHTEGQGLKRARHDTLWMIDVCGRAVDGSMD